MPSMDIFENDAFSVKSLTLAISQTPYVPGRIGALGLYTEEGINTTSAMIELEGESLSLVAAGERGAPGQNVTSGKRGMVQVRTVHLPQTATILADEIQNVRPFGEENDVQAVEQVVVKRLKKMRRRLDATIEYHKLGGIKGQVLDANGVSVLYDFFQIFGLTKSTFDMVLDSDATKVLQMVLSAKRMSEDKLGGAMSTGWRALCSPEYFDAFTGHKTVTDAFNFYNAQVKSKDNRSGFMFGDVIWEEYRGKVGGVDFVSPGKALMVPEGVADMFVANYAPADYMETANSNGLPYYAKQELTRMAKGVELESQSNPVCINSRPTAVIELSI